ncbi:tetratricopeptide repeat protein [Pontimicrobium sp. MEBiC01747]
MKQIIIYILLLTTVFSYAQEEDKALELATKKANDLVYKANDLASNDDFISAEMEYRKALSQKPTSVAGTYNLAHSYYKEGNYEEALYRNKQAAKNATDKAEKHRAYHNIGNILMQNNECKQAVEAYKNALRNDPTDDESRYNLGLAKECAKKQEQEQEQDDKGDDKKDKKEDKNKDEKDKKEKDKKDENKEDQKDKGDKDKKEGDDQKDDKGKPKDEKDDKGKEGDDKKEQQKPQQQPGQLSQQQIKNLLEAMNNQEQKVQEKMNAKKAKGVKVQTEKDW